MCLQKCNLICTAREKIIRDFSSGILISIRKWQTEVFVFHKSLFDELCFNIFVINHVGFYIVCIVDYPLFYILYPLFIMLINAENKTYLEFSKVSALNH